MKRLLIGDHREELLSTLEVILRHWGYRVLASSRPEQLVALLRETTPDLLIMGAGMLGDSESPLAREVQLRVADGAAPLIVLLEPEGVDPVAAPHEALAVPLDLFALFALVQKHLEKYPRRTMRLALQLPGMLCSGENCQLAEVLSLSLHGLFVKTGFRAAQGERLRVVFPLLGMQKELELEGRILYRVEPAAENNYLQGVGIEFSALSEETRTVLEAFLEQRFLSDLTARPDGEQGLAPQQLKERRGELTLRLTPR